MGLKVRIWASTLGSGPQGRDMGLEAEIWARRLGGAKEKEKKEKKEKIPLCESIGHRLLRGRCPKKGGTNRRTDGRTQRGVHRLAEC